MTPQYRAFLERMPAGGKILDAGCGSGRDTRYFLQHGYLVEAFDASAEMCQLASEYTGQKVHHRTFDEVHGILVFDGVWACASLLHVRRDSIDAVLRKLCCALKVNGVMFVSFKLRDEEWEDGGRLFNGYSQRTFETLLTKHPSLRCFSMWISEDA